jgi:CO/xanthine dehydrogenase Mo-binding subunit
MAVPTTRDVKGAGLRIPRPDGREKVTGRTHYVADLQPRGLLHARLLRSPHAHARIKLIDVSKARALPGVRAILTAADIPELRPAAPTRAHAILAIDRVIFVGQPVAAVAADEPSIADEALDLIEVEYEPLPATLSGEQALRPEAPPVADTGTKADASEALAHSAVAFEGSSAPSEAPNLVQQTCFSRGDVAAGFAEADLVLERAYHVPMVNQGYIEPHAVIAAWDRPDHLTLWTSTQGQFQARTEVADVLGLPEMAITVVPLECGGGFGAKIRALCEPIAALLARATGRPVRYVMSRREELEAGMPAPSITIRLKTGVKRDGSLCALEAETLIDSGAFAGSVLTMNAVMLGSLYRWPSFEVRGYEVLTHKQSIAAYRAPTSPQTTFALDCQMELLARELGLDPVEFRRRHYAREGDPMAHGKPWARHGFEQVLDAATSHRIWQKREAWKASSRQSGAGLRGTGLAIGGWVPGLQAASATVRLNADGTLSAITGSVDISGTNISLAQIAATAFGVDVDQVQTINGDSDSAPFAGTAAGSKTIYTVGSAMLLAAQDARRQTFDIAAAELEASVDDLELVAGRVQVKGVSERGLSLGQIGKMTNAYMTRHAPVLGRGSFATTTQAPGFSCQVAQVEVDPDTGQVTIHDFLVVQDVGFAINPLGVEGQMLGGAVQGLGIGLTEGLQYDPESGRVLNPSLLDYRQLTAADLPEIDSIIVEVPSEVGPLGARGVGEPPIVPGAAALANAVLDATGVQITELPITPERVALALEARRG